MNHKSTLIALALTLFISFSALAQNRISVNALPKPAQTFLSKYFDKVKIQKVEKDFDDGKIKYEVKLSGNTEIDFDSNGNWKEISGKIPAHIIPAEITQSVKYDYKNKRIVKIEREHHGGYEIELANGMDITYDKNFNVIHLDK